MPPLSPYLFGRFPLRALGVVLRDPSPDQPSIENLVAFAIAIAVGTAAASHSAQEAKREDVIVFAALLAFAVQALSLEGEWAMSCFGH